MAQQEFPSLNGIAPSWADVSIKLTPLGGSLVETADIASIDLSDSIEFGMVRGTGGTKRKRTTGQEDNEGTITLYREGDREFMRALVAKAPSRNGQKQVGLVVFSIVVFHTPPGDNGIYEVRVLGCRLAGRSYSMAEGTDADKVEHPINVMKVVEIIDGEEVVLL